MHLSVIIHIFTRLKHKYCFFQNRTEQNIFLEQNRTFILFKHIQLITITKFQMHGLLNMHIQFNNYSLDGINFTIVLE